MNNCNHSNCHHCNNNHKSCVSLVPIFNHLEDNQMEEIVETIKPGKYKKGEIIYSAGNRSDSLYIVNKGRIRIFRLSESGKEQLVRILQVGDFTGELALFSDTTHESYAQAMEDTEVCMINRSDLQDFLLRYPSISLKILSEFSSRLEKAEKQTTSVSTEKVETRIARFISEIVGNTKSMEFTLPMSKKDLASYLGTTPETISRKLAEFEDVGYIKQKTARRILVLDLDKLRLL